MYRLIGMVLFVLVLSGCNTGNKNKTSEEPVITTVEISVDGMHCMGCVETVQASARQVAGVDSAFASLPEAMARVTFDASVTDTTAIRKAIELNGYKVTGIKSMN